MDGVRHDHADRQANRRAETFAPRLAPAGLRVIHERLISVSHILAECAQVAQTILDLGDRVSGLAAEYPEVRRVLRQVDLQHAVEIPVEDLCAPAQVERLALALPPDPKDDAGALSTSFYIFRKNRGRISSRHHDDKKTTNHQTQARRYGHLLAESPR